MSGRLGRIRSHLCAAPSPSTSSTGICGAAVAATLAAAADPAAANPCSVEMIASFRANGFLLIPGLVPLSELAAVDSDSLALIEKGLGGPFGDARWNFGDDGPDSQIPRRINGLADDDMPESFRLLLAYPPLLAAAAACMADVIGESKAFAAGVYIHAITPTKTHYFFSRDASDSLLAFVDPAPSSTRSPNAASPYP